MNRIALFALAGLLAAQVMLGEGFWLKKEYTQWTQEEVQKIMKDSPWAREISVSMSPPNPDVNIGDGGLTKMMNAAAAGTNIAGESATMVIGWRSSLPLKEAVLRGRMLAGNETTDEGKTLSNAETAYIIVVSGVPLDVGRTAQQSEVIHQSTLKVDKKELIHPIAANFEVHDQTMDIFLAFPRTEPITVEDDEVEVDVKLGTFDAKEKFKLKDMLFNGKLEL